MIATLLFAAALAVTPGQRAAQADWLAHGQDPYLRYLSFEGIDRKHAKDWDATCKFSVASASRAELLDHHLPVRLHGTLMYRIHLGALQWDVAEWLKVLEKYPYDTSKNPLVVNGPWLLYQLADVRDSDALYRLLYGKDIPKTDADFLKFWGVDENQQTGQRFGWIETKSRVAKQETRFIERFNARGQSLWRTKDTNEINADSDPLEHLDGNTRHDGRELIAQFSKTSVAYGARGAAQAYLLANGQGNVVQEAPVRLVEDYGRTLNQTAIINHAGCITCHAEGGMQMPSENGLRAYLKAGATLYAYDRGQKEQIELFHLGDVVRQLERDNENYAVFVKCCNGLTTLENAAAYKQSLGRYIAELSLEDAARELYTDGGNLRLALGWAATANIEIGARLSGLAHGRKLPRHQWEKDYLRARVMLSKWEGSK